MNNKTCKTCVNFYLHYVASGNYKFTDTYCGHCVYPRLKTRQPDHPACPHYEEKKQPPEDDPLHLSDSEILTQIKALLDIRKA